VTYYGQYRDEIDREIQLNEAGKRARAGGCRGR